MKLYEVIVYPGEYVDGLAKNVSTGDMQKIVVHAHDGVRAQEQVLAMFGGPTRARTAGAKELR